MGTWKLIQCLETERLPDYDYIPAVTQGYKKQQGMKD